VEAGGQRRLGDEHRLGGATDVPAAGDLEKPLNLGKQHPLAIDVFYSVVKKIGLRPMADIAQMTHVTRNS
jgi:hypothetical protein